MEPRSKLLTRGTLGTLALASALSWVPLSRATAEPYLALRTGLKCSHCHVNRTGGGGRNGYGSVWSQTQLPMRTFDVRTRNLASWVAIGLDFRGAFDAALTSGVEPRTAFAVKESQVQLEAQLIDDILTFYLDQTVEPDRAKAREVFGMAAWRPLNGYAKVGKFLLPYGWRLWDDQEFIRSATNFTYATPDVGVEVGIEPGPLSWAVSVTNGSFSGTESNGAKLVATNAVLTFRRWRVGASAARNAEPGARREIVGAYAGFSVGPLVFLGETDFVFDSFDDTTSTDRDQVLAFVEGDWLITRGLNLKATYGFQDPSASIRAGVGGQPGDQGDRRTRARVGLEAFPVPFVQLSGFWVRWNEAVDADDRDVITLEAHVYF
ncbi:MAG: hypothetical protein JSW43_10000 [Gemmatimonadota bacterium]|nr:MAG: hypothetical protein JSW43_10000 [Gemmatimonadota bacterium]